MDDDGQEIKKPKNVLDNLNYAIEGVIYAVKHERHMRYHFIIAAGALLLMLVLRVPALEFGLFALAIVILLFAEMVNTAVEEVVNLVEEKYNLLAKNAKDVAAGAVLISSLGVIITFYMIFANHMYDPIESLLREAPGYTGHLSFVSILLVLILVVALKAVFGRGTPLRGGMPSGHAAVSFSIWTAVTLISLDLKIVIMTFVLAVLVSHSRLIGKIHTAFEILMGALLGIGLTCLVFYIFSITAVGPR